MNVDADSAMEVDPQRAMVVAPIFSLYTSDTEAQKTSNEKIVDAESAMEVDPKTHGVYVSVNFSEITRNFLKL